MLQDRVKSTREPINNGKFINQFSSDIIKIDAAPQKDKYKNV